MKEIENQGRVAALETKLAAIAEMIEETEGRLTRIQETRRPGNVWPEIWQRMSERQQERAIEEWKIEKPKREKAGKDAEK